ncbi:MAG: hypothetical protein AAFW75_12355 [Cyanobacteria bacterium J06636_16]
MTVITNYHVTDPHNIGDLLSSPLQYFDFPGYACQTRDIRTIDSENVESSHAVIGGGGLLFKRFLKHIEAINGIPSGKHILWGAGQQSYGTEPTTLLKFDYQPYIAHSDLVGIRDDRTAHTWVPCVSCMHPAFDQPRTAKHEFVVFSHKKFQLDFPQLPRMTNETTNLEEVLDFLGSGETILTSSFHGAYWGTLLGRKVLAFPFSSKFFTLRHQPTLYPAQRWSQVRWRLSMFGKVLYTSRHEGNKHTCETKNWRQYVAKCQTYPDSLEECRERNHWFYERVMGILSE